MKIREMFFVIVIGVFLPLSYSKADDRYDIVSLDGRDNSIMTQPSYEVVEGQEFLKRLTRVSAHRFDSSCFWNENSKGVLVLCKFNPKKTAFVFVDDRGCPLYLEGCRGGTFFNRIQLVVEEKKVVVVVPEPRCEDTPEIPMYQPQYCPPPRPMVYRQYYCPPCPPQQRIMYRRPPPVRQICRPPMRIQQCPPQMMRQRCPSPSYYQGGGGFRKAYGADGTGSFRRY